MAKAVLVAVSNEKNIELLSQFSCTLAREEKATLYALYVVEVPHSLPLDAELPEEEAQGEKILERVEEIAEEPYNVPVETEIFHARRAGPAILEMATEKKAEVLVIGATLKATFSERLFGSTVEYLLRKAPCRVVVLRPERHLLTAEGMR